jgi:O-antigen ligase
MGSSHIQASAMEALRIASVAMMFVVLEQLITNRKALVRTIVWCYVGLLYPLLYTTFGMAMGDPNSDVKGSFTRLSGPFNQSNTFSRYLAFMIVMGVALHPTLQRRFAKWAFGGIIALSGVYMLLTLTRTAIIGAFAGIVIVIVIQRRKRLLIGLAVGAVAAMVLLPGVGARFATLDAQSSIGGGPTGNTLEWRLRYWTEVLPLANQNPVTGIGLNVTQYQTDAAKQPHNDFIRAYVEMGAVGLVAFIVMLTALVGNARRAVFRARPETLERAVGAGALGAAAALVLECAAANVMSNVVSLWYLFAFAACATYIARTDPDARSDETAAPVSPVRREDAAVVEAAAG